MGLPCYLAMTAVEFAGMPTLPQHTAWMACYFSGSGTGLSNLPGHLPPNAMLILNDSIPFSGHDPEKILAQLTNTVKAWDCRCLLLDLQRPGSRDVADLCRLLVEALPCPVVLSEDYAKDLSCPVFLSAPPLLTRLSRHLAPWEGREIWLEAALDKAVVTVTEDGSTLTPSTDGELPEPWFTEAQLFCRYHWALEGKAARFTILRTKEDLSAMLHAAKDLGVKGAVGLYQELQ